MGSNHPQAPWFEGWQSHPSAFEVDTTPGGYSDWFEIVWRIKCGNDHYVATATIMKPGGTRMYESSPITMNNFANGSTVYPCYAPGVSIP